MTEPKARRIILKYHWKPWLSRPFFGFMMSTFRGGNSKRAFTKIGLKNWQYQSFMFSNGEWWEAEEVYQKTKQPVLRWLKKHQVKEISLGLEKFYAKWKSETVAMAKHPHIEPLRKLKRLTDILREITTYVWAVHALEHYFTPLLKQQTKKYVKSNVDKFIGDASYPDKLNAAEQLIYEYKKGVPVSTLAKNFGWMRARDGFSDPYTKEEIKNIVIHALDQTSHIRPNIPEALRPIYEDARELVYLRMLRMDIYYELMYLAKPLLKVVAKKFNIPFDQLKYYSAESLLTGKPKRYPRDFCCYSFNDEIFYQENPLFGNKAPLAATELKGSIAQTGIAKGKVKIISSVADLPKMKKGDILITYMTSPNFLPAMKLAAAFVTNEGGLTCHAAIVAREMGKPCIIGTKVATKVLKDGDMVEVDANKGIVKLL